MKKGIDGAVAAVNGVLTWYYSLLGASNLMASLYVIGGLTVAWIVGSWFDLYTICFIGQIISPSLSSSTAFPPAPPPPFARSLSLTLSIASSPSPAFSSRNHTALSPVSASQLSAATTASLAPSL